MDAVQLRATGVLDRLYAILEEVHAGRRSYMDLGWRQTVHLLAALKTPVSADSGPHNLMVEIVHLFR